MSACDDDLDLNDQTQNQSNELEIDPRDVGSETTPLQGTLFLHWVPSSQSTLSRSNFLTFQNQLPSSLYVEWPNTLSLTGSVWIADDTLSSAQPISSQVWFIDPFLNQRLLPFSDQDPFSPQQFLVRLPPWRTSFDFQQEQYTPFREAIIYEASINTSSFPPRRFKSIQLQDRIQLTLPPKDALYTLQGQVWINPAIGLTYSQLEVSAYYQNKRISTRGITDTTGRFTLQFWNDQPFSPLKLKITPPAHLPLPTLWVERGFSDQNPSSLSTTLSYPPLDTLSPLSIQFANQTQGHFVLYTHQTWPSSGDSSFTDELFFKKTYLHKGTEERQVWLYPQPTLLYVHSPSTQIERTLRLELPASSSSRLVIQPQFKSAVRGLIQTFQNQAVESQIKAYQLAWPWGDAKDLPLGEYSTSTDVEGTFSMNLDPGTYALVIQPLDPQWSRKVVLIEVGTDSSLLLNSNELRVSPSQPFSIQLTFPHLISSNSDPFISSSSSSNLSALAHTPSELDSPYTLKLGCQISLNPRSPDDSQVHYVPFLNLHTRQTSLTLMLDPKQICPLGSVINQVE